MRVLPLWSNFYSLGLLIRLATHVLQTISLVECCVVRPDGQVWASMSVWNTPIWFTYVICISWLIRLHWGIWLVFILNQTGSAPLLCEKLFCMIHKSQPWYSSYGTHRLVFFWFIYYFAIVIFWDIIDFYFYSRFLNLLPLVILGKTFSGFPQVAIQ